MRALRGAAALLRGAAGCTLAPQLAALPGAGALAAAELARRLDQGWAVRHAATATGDVSGRGPSRTRAPNAGKRGEKTADGRPKPDERTVADLVRRGWFESEEAAVALLTKTKSIGSRFPFETAEPAADWLEAALGPEPVKNGLCPAAKAVRGFPHLLYRDAATLQRKWDALTLPAERGGVGIAFSTEQAREVVRLHPQLLTFSVDTFKAGWSMLTEGGLCQTVEEARQCILRGPEILRFNHDKVMQRVALLMSFGYVEALAVVLKQPRVLNYKEATVKEHAAWWQQTGLDHVKLVTVLPQLLGGVSVKELQAKLNFLSHLAKLSVADLNCGAPFFIAKPDKLRSRFFYALKHGALERYKLSSLIFCSEARFLRLVHQLDQVADARKVAEFKQELASPAFRAWAAQEEARRL